jgi:hypothetical protein
MSNPDPSLVLTVTHHARRRAKERLALPARAAQTAAQRALDTGALPETLPLHLRTKLEKSMQSHRATLNANVVDHFARIYRGHAFVFGRATQLAPGGESGVLPDVHVLLTILPDYDPTKQPVEFMFPDAMPKIKRPKTRIELRKHRKPIRKQQPYDDPEH